MAGAQCRAHDPGPIPELTTRPPCTPFPPRPGLGTRAEGLFAATAILARKLNRDYDGLDERNRFAHGEITIDDLQILRNKLAAELEQKRSRARLSTPQAWRRILGVDDNVQ